MWEHMLSTERGRMLFQQLHDAPCLTDVWKGMWEPIPRNVLRTRSRNHPGDGFAWFSMTLVTRVLDCGDSRNQDELWQTTHVCDPETRHETCEAKVQIRMARGKMPSVLPRLFADKHVVNDRQPMTASRMLLGGW